MLRSSLVKSCLVLVVASRLTSGCASSSSCMRNSDCLKGATCVSGECVVPTPAPAADASADSDDAGSN